jgi:hypothetical protein
LIVNVLGSPLGTWQNQDSKQAKTLAFGFMLHASLPCSRSYMDSKVDIFEDIGNPRHSSAYLLLLLLVFQTRSDAFKDILGVPWQ